MAHDTLARLRGVRLDRDLDGDEVAGIVGDADRLVVPRSLVAQLDGHGPAGRPTR